MRHRLGFSDEARLQLRALARATRRNIGYRIDLLQNDLQGDVKSSGIRGVNIA
jgi:phage-related protein